MGNKLLDGFVTEALDILKEVNISMRDHIAIQALQGMLSHSRNGHGYIPRDGREDWHSAIAEEAYEIADAMLRERNK